jgi:hypothetical protein
LDEWRHVDAELDAGVELDVTEWRAAPLEKAALVEKVAGAVESAGAGRWPGGEEGWRAAALEHRGERGRAVRRGGERHGVVVALEHAMASWTRRFGMERNGRRAHERT